jgi:polyvinyl alcohol dehydrogenase (cytochrome)
MKTPFKPLFYLVLLCISSACFAASANETTIPPATQIVDSSNNIWTVSSGVIQKNGVSTPSAKVILLLWFNGTIYQENANHHWWAWNGTGWGPQIAGDPRTWTMGGQNLLDWRNQSATGINAQNVQELKQKWVFTTGGIVTATPAVANGIAYFPDSAGNFYAVNADTGALTWSHRLLDWTGIADDTARDDPVVFGDMVILGDLGGRKAVWNGKTLVGPGASLISVNGSTGKLNWATQVETFPAALITGSPVVYDGIVYVGVTSREEGLATQQSYPCCVSRGSLVALDVQTGKRIWQTYMVPDNGGKADGYSGAGIWDSTPVIDTKRNLIYVGTGNNYSVPKAVENCINANKNSLTCSDSADYFDAVVALDLKTGLVKWAHRAMAYDAANSACDSVPAGVNCPYPRGPDYDFGGAGPNLLTVLTSKVQTDILGIGEKSGIYWALNPDTGAVLWRTLVGPGGLDGGIQWGTATDGTRIYVPISNSSSQTYTLQPSGLRVNSGSWAALDPATGQFLWQTATPGTCSRPESSVIRGCMASGPASAANGVLFVGSMDTAPSNPTMFALDAQTGKILWSFPSTRSIIAAPAIVGNFVYWGSGTNKLFAFSF